MQTILKPRVVLRTLLGAGHNDLAWVAGERYWTALREFAASLPATNQGDAGR